MKPTSDIGVERLKSFASCTTTQLTLSVSALPTARVGGADTGRQRRAAVYPRLHRTLFEWKELRERFHQDSSRFHLLSCQRCSQVCRWLCADGNRESTAGDQSGFRDHLRRYPQLKNKPIVIGESDPDGCAACQGAQPGVSQLDDVFELHGCEASRGSLNLLKSTDVNLEGALTWAFEFEEQPLLRRLSRAGDKRYRPAGAECLQDV